MDAPQGTGRDAEAAAVEAGRLLFAGPIEFLRGATAIDQLPSADRPEVAFAGRSNVGKSSLINALAGRRNLARTSNTPGRTQELNFFALGEGLRLVDMPGYGYAEAPIAKVKAWNALILDYLRGRPNLRRVYVLVDARHGLKRNDADVMDTLDKSAVSYQVVLTKADKVKAPALAATLARTAEATRKRPACHPEVIVTSSQEGLGVERLRAEIAALGPPRD